MQLLDRGRHPYISTGFGGKQFYSPCFCPFYGVLANIMKVASVILGTHETHACKLSLQANKH